MSFLFFVPFFFLGRRGKGEGLMISSFFGSCFFCLCIFFNCECKATWRGKRGRKGEFVW